MSEAAVANLSLARLVKIEQRVVGSEHAAMRARWESGHELLSHRENGRVPYGYLKSVVSEVGVSRQELGYRMRFAEVFATEGELTNALVNLPSWREVVSSVLPKRETNEGADASGDAPLPEGVFRTIAADPPWQYGNKATRAAAEDHYPTLSLAELCELPVEDWAADEAHLYLWATNGFLREAFEVMDSWGFTYKTTLTWVKPQLGLGNYFRSSTEHVLFGVRGGLKTLDSNQFNWFEARQGKHSKKPGRFFDLVEKCSPGPFLEMFARTRRLGWESWGNEV